jgi:regulator of sigma E protease
MEILVKAGQFLLSLSILVILHEMGHFLFAKLFGARVEKFYLFFNPWFSLFKVRRGETEYGVGWLPLGGYVKISGMIDESMDKEQMKQPPQPYEFRSKPAWQRLFIMIGGVLVNFVLALIIYSAILFTWGEEYLATKNAKYGVACDSLASDLGFRNGDKILTVSGQEIENFLQVSHDILLNDDREVVVLRGEDTMKINIPKGKVSKLIKNPMLFIPRLPFIVDELKKDDVAEKAGLKKGDKLVAINNEPKQFFDEFKTAVQENKNKDIVVTVLRDTQTVNISLHIPETAIVGVYPLMELKEFFEINKREYTFFQSIPAGIKRGFSTIRSYLKQLKLIFSPETQSIRVVGRFYYHWKDISFNLGLGSILGTNGIPFHNPCHYEYSSYSCFGWRTRVIFTLRDDNGS